MRTNYNEQEPDTKSINEAIEEAKDIAQQTRIQDEKEAKEMGMTLEQFYKEREEMHDDSWITNNETGIW